MSTGSVIAVIGGVVAAIVTVDRLKSADPRRFSDCSLRLTRTSTDSAATPPATSGSVSPTVINRPADFMVAPTRLIDVCATPANRSCWHLPHASLPCTGSPR